MHFIVPTTPQTDSLTLSRNAIIRSPPQNCTVKTLCGHNGVPSLQVINRLHTPPNDHSSGAICTQFPMTLSLVLWFCSVVPFRESEKKTLFHFVLVDARKAIGKARNQEIEIKSRVSRRVSLHHHQLFLISPHPPAYKKHPVSSTPHLFSISIHRIDRQRN